MTDNRAHTRDVYPGLSSSEYHSGCFSSNPLTRGVEDHVELTAQICYLYVDTPDGIIIMPFSPIAQAWHVLGVLWVLYTCFVSTFEIAFLSSIELNWLFVVNRLADLYFILDFVTCFRTASRQEVSGKFSRQFWQIDPTKIRRLYLAGWFWPDLFSSIPFDLLIYYVQEKGTELILMKFFRVLRLLKLIRLSKSLSVLRHLGLYDYLNYELVTFFQLGFTYLTCMHWLGCLFYATTEFEDAEENWLTSYGIDDSTLPDKYITSLYWSTMTITTVGYGEVKTVTTIERIVATFCMFGVLADTCLLLNHP